jgi:hypothetical protein
MRVLARIPLDNGGSLHVADMAPWRTMCEVELRETAMRALRLVQKVMPMARDMLLAEHATDTLFDARDVLLAAGAGISLAVVGDKAALTSVVLVAQRFDTRQGEYRGYGFRAPNPYENAILCAAAEASFASLDCGPLQ